MVASSHEDAARVGCGTQSRICWRVHLAGSGFFFGRPRQGGVAERDHTNTWRSEIAGPGVCSVYSRVENGRRTAADRSCTRNGSGAWAADAVSPRCAAGRPAARRCPSPALAHVEHDPAQQLVALRVEAPRDQCERHPAGPGSARRTRRQLVEVRDGGERGQRLHEQDRRGVEQGGPSQMPLPKPTAIRTWPAIAVIGAAVATTLKFTPISPTAFGRGRWTALVLGSG
jgi:hypothetical protein